MLYYIHFPSLCWSNWNDFPINWFQPLFKNGYIKFFCLPFRCISNNPFVFTQIQRFSLVSLELRSFLATLSLTASANLEAASHYSNHSLISLEKTMAVVAISKHLVPSRSTYFMFHLWDICKNGTKLTLFLGFPLLGKLPLLFSFLCCLGRMSKRAWIGLFILPESHSKQCQSTELQI